ncbi:MAG: deoxyribonuclease V [Armatimonadetes bacterium]|nr:deoxyribonuclease V [Armatimonadota bacterium]
MKPEMNLTNWNPTPREAVQVQLRMRELVRIEDDFGFVGRVAGVDVRIGRGWKDGKCGIVVLSFPNLEMIETRVYCAPVTFPYVPGLLAFREVPIFLKTYELLNVKPDLLFFDGHGLAHPRRFGLACHAGAILDLPSIGCAKSRLIGEYDEPGMEAGSATWLVAPEGDFIGQVVRTKSGVKPVFISPGHRVSFEAATKFALACVRNHRVPEPTRQAHLLLSSG